MYFNTLDYVGFFLFVTLAYRMLSAPAAVLLVASIVFYVVAGWFDTVLITGLIGFNWLLFRLIDNARLRVLLAVIGNIGVLAWIKYRTFLLSGEGLASTAYIDTVLPLGISFYTFQMLALQIDAMRHPALREQHGLSFPLFVIFFPQLIAGPIVRAQQLLPQIRRLVDGKRRRLRLYSVGVGLCLLGLTKKIVLADSLAPVVDDIFFLETCTTFEAWVGAWLFTFQIYFDFSGYSDIALGCAYLLGIRLPLNFRTPYMSRSPREFWQRWHITLSTWIRDYLYIPLGGGRGNRLRQFVVLVLVMGLAGLWHGADVTFVVWGLLWGVYIGMCRLASRRFAVTGRCARCGVWIGHFGIIVVLWVFFRSPDMPAAMTYLRTLFAVGPVASEPHALSSPATLVILGCASLLLLHYLEARVLQTRGILIFLRRWNGPFALGVMAGLCVCLVVLPSFDINPFIYFRF